MCRSHAKLRRMTGRDVRSEMYKSPRKMERPSYGSIASAMRKTARSAPGDGWSAPGHPFFFAVYAIGLQKPGVSPYPRSRIRERERCYTESPNLRNNWGRYASRSPYDEEVYITIIDQICTGGKQGRNNSPRGAAPSPIAGAPCIEGWPPVPRGAIFNIATDLG